MISCIDIDECEEENPCGDDEDCVNTEGSYTCQKKEEYQVNYFVLLILKIETIELFHPLISFLQDKNLCPVGYSLTDGECKDINECQTGAHTCKDSQRCDNTIGSFVCVR